MFQATNQTPTSIESIVMLMGKSTINNNVPNHQSAIYG